MLLFILFSIAVIDTGTLAQLDIITEDTPLALRGACISNPCLHKGLCSVTPSGFICTCVNGYVGVQCERKADDCPRDKMMKCVHGICKLDMSGNPHCICIDGFIGPSCSISINNCASAPCKNGGSCHDKSDGFECNCPPKTYGSHCQISESEIDKCISNCDGYPNNGKCWHESPENVTVGWGYGDLICNSRQTCFDMKESEHSQYEYMEVQLKPVQLQSNDDLVFMTDRDAVLYDYHFIPHILPMEVNSEEDFRNCNTSDAIPLTNDPTISRLSVNESLLRVGTQYFLADTNTLHRCIFGLRVNVTVKDRDCFDPDSSSGLPCNGHGKCFSDFNRIKFECLCCDGYTGTYCQYEDPCSVQPCANNAKCHIQDYGLGVLKHQCVCPKGYHGKSCNKVIDFCLSAPCKNGAGCYTELNGYRCHCKTGFSGNNCQINNDECGSSPCKNNGTCVDGLDNFHCQCPTGFQGTLCEVDIDECQSQPCINGTCLDSVNNYTCACAAGYSGNNCEIRLDECDSQPCVHGKCIKEKNGFSCSCGIGFTGQFCELKLDLCLHSKFCILKNARTCADLGNNVSCTCLNGWTGNNCGININDCKGNGCKNDGKCVDNLNGYQCRCKKGYKGLYCEVPSSKISPDIEIDFMTDNCQKFQDPQEVHKLERNIVMLLQDACQCSFTVSSIKFGSTRVTCKDGMAGKFMTDLAGDDVDLRKKVVCDMQETIRTKNTPNIYHNTYLVTIADNSNQCHTGDKRKVPEAEDDHSTNTGVIVGMLVGVLLLLVILIFVLMKVRNTRRKVGVAYKFERETISFDNAAYGKSYSDDDTLNQSTLDETSFMSNNDVTATDVMPDETKWAVSYDRSRQLYERNGNVPVGRLFDIHNPAGPSTSI